VAETQAIRKAQKTVHEKARPARCRAQEGRYTQTRDKYNAQAAERAQKAQELRETGLSIREIAAAMDASIGAVHRWL